LVALVHDGAYDCNRHNDSTKSREDCAPGARRQHTTAKEEDTLMSTTKTSTEAAKEKAAAIHQRLSSDKDSRDRWIGVYIGIIAAFMAVCAMLGNNATKDANRYNIEANNNWNFFQAKNLRRQVVRLHVDQLELDLASNPALAEGMRVAYKKRIEDYKALDKRLSSDPATKEGLDELFTKGKALEAQRDEAFAKDPYFDWAQALLQIAIVLASVCLITGSVWLVYMSGALGLLGLLMMANGKFMLVSMPFIN
jgi:hypothetical protein